jgi:hypothetical protein
MEESKEVARQPEALAVIVANSGIEKTKAQTVLDSFTQYFEEASKWEAQTKGLVITDVSQTKEMNLAREGRLQLKQVRVNAKKTHDKLKEESLIQGRFIDAIYNLIEGVTKPIETALLEKEQFVERQEAARIEAIRVSRAEALAVYEVDTSFYDLGNMPESSYAQLLENSRIAAESRAQAQRKAEEDRIAAEKAEQEERARIAEENARLKAEAEKREAEIAAERKAREDAEAIERARVEAEQKAKDEAARAEQAKIEAENERLRQEAEKARRELQAKADAEAEAARKEAARVESERIAKIEAARKAAQAGDAEKVLTYIDSLDAVQGPIVSNPAAQAIVNSVMSVLAKARTQAGNLK